MDNNDTTDDAPIETPSADASATVLISLEGTIKNHISMIDKLEEDLDKHASMLKDIFENDPTFKEHSEKAKEASRIKMQTRQQILKQPQAADLNEKVKSMKSQIKELDGALSDYLREFQRMSGVNEIEGEDGELREIVYVAKLVKKSPFRP
jgi:hypothetical protein